MSDDIATFKHIRSHRGMYFIGESVDEAVAFINGFDLARNEALLLGFREWLVVRVGEGWNLSWPPMVQMFATKRAENVHQGENKRGSTARRDLVDEVLCTLLEFLEDKEKRGLRSVYLDFQHWLEQQNWYGPKSPDWYEPPA